jgi:hypothetical protein
MPNLKLAYRKVGCRGGLAKPIELDMGAVQSRWIFEEPPATMEWARNIAWGEGFPSFLLWKAGIMAKTASSKFHTRPSELCTGAFTHENVPIML